MSLNWDTEQYDNKDTLLKFATTGQKNIDVFYHPWLDGGGRYNAKEFCAIIHRKYTTRKFTRCFEWCAGPGFIGFELLDHDVCQTLCLSESYDPSVVCTELTIEENKLEDRVTTYLLKDLSLLPITEKFDLVVANPPHYSTAMGKVAQATDYTTHRLSIDKHWKAHINFFNNIKKHLTDNGVIFLFESHKGSTVDSFNDKIIQAGLQITEITESGDNYYMEITHA